MRFSVIYSVDVPANESIVRYFPPNHKKKWDCTERDSEYQYGYLEDKWEKGKHRKFCAILDRKEFESFIAQCELFAERVETMGSIGAPGFGFGHAPAISFCDLGDRPAIRNAYVTPIPKRMEVREKPCDEKAWKRIRNAILSLYE